MSTLSEIKMDYLVCHTVGHGWDSIPDDREMLTFYKNDKTAQRELFRCGRCRTKRLDVISRITGDLADRQYDYPHDYSLEIGELAEGQTRRKLARLEFIGR